VKTAFWIASAAAIFDVALDVILTHVVFSDAVFWRIRTGKSICVGIGVGVLLLFALGLMAKPMLVTLPFVLLLLDYWPGSSVSG
jgi:hypothetical protein